MITKEQIDRFGRHLSDCNIEGRSNIAGNTSDLISLLTLARAALEEIDSLECYIGNLERLMEAFKGVDTSRIAEQLQASKARLAKLKGGE